MLWVNNVPFEEARFRQFGHAKWGEFPTFTDMIFPWFLLIVGCAMPLSWASRRAKGTSLPQLWAHSLKRAAILFCLGCIIDSSISKRVVVGMGVLQLIGVSFLIASVACHLKSLWRGVLTGGMLVAYWALIRFFPVPGIGSGFFFENQNVIRYLNQEYLAPIHAAGILSGIPGAAEILIGTMLGDLLRRESPPREKMRLMAAWGAALALAGLLWHLDLPMSKHVWSSPYILFSAGIGVLVLAGFYWLIDIRGWQKWAHLFVVFGMNAITAYFLSIVVRIHTVQEWTIETAAGKATLWQAAIDWCGTTFGTVGGSWLFTASYIFIWWLVLFWMHRRKLYWRI
jgi:predicted acyltransferase